MKNSIIIVVLIFLLTISTIGCGLHTKEDIEEALQEAYRLGYTDGYNAGYNSRVADKETATEEYYRWLLEGLRECEREERLLELKELRGLE